MKKSVIKNIVNNAYSFSLIAKIISVITGLVYSILFSRYLGAELRGTASIINNYSELIMLVLCFGVYQAYPYFKKKNGENKYTEYINLIFGMFLVYSGIVAAFILIVRPSVSVAVTAVLIPLLMGIKQLNYVVLIENPKLRNMAQIWLDLFDIVFLGALMIFTTANYFYCVLFLIVKQVVCFIIAVANLKIPLHKIRPTLKGIWSYVKYGFIPMLTVILMEVNYKVDVLMLDWFQISQAEIGVYSLGVMLAQKLWLIPDALKDILLSKLAGGKTESEVCKVTRISFWVTIICVIGMVFLGKPLIWLLFGPEYSDAYLIILVIMVGVLGMVFYKMIYSYNVVNGHKNINFVILGVSSLINVVLNAAVIPFLGIMGAGLASLISYTACGIAFLLYFCKKTNIPLKELVLLKKSDIKQIKKMLKK